MKHLPAILLLSTLALAGCRATPPSPTETKVAYWTKRHLFGVRQLNPPAWSRAEAAWLGGYAVLSFIYRVVVLLAISLLVTSRYLFIGSLVAVWSMYMTLVSPLWKAIKAPLRDGRLRALLSLGKVPVERRDVRGLAAQVGLRGGEHVAHRDQFRKALLGDPARVHFVPRELALARERAHVVSP